MASNGINHVGINTNEHASIAKLLAEARRDLLSQTGRILPDLRFLQGIGQTLLAGGIIDDRKYLVRPEDDPLHLLTIKE